MLNIKSCPGCGSEELDGTKVDHGLVIICYECESIYEVNPVGMLPSDDRSDSNAQAIQDCNV